MEENELKSLMRDLLSFFHDSEVLERFDKLFRERDAQELLFYGLDIRGRVNRDIEPVNLARILTQDLKAYLPEMVGDYQKNIDSHFCKSDTAQRAIERIDLWEPFAQTNKPTETPPSREWFKRWDWSE